MDKNIAALLDTSAYTIKVMFKLDKQSRPTQYLYVCNIPDVKVGDWVVVDAPDYDDYVGSMPLRNGGSIEGMMDLELATVFTGMPKTVVVTAVHSEVEIEPDAPTKYKWVVAKVDTAAYIATMQRNAQVTSLVADAYKKATRRSFSERILQDMDTDKRQALLGMLDAPKAV